MSSFTKRWTREKTPSGTIHRPIVNLVFQEKQGYNLYSFIVDSGADISLAPRLLAERIGLNWGRGSRRILRGISAKPECFLDGRIHETATFLPDLALPLTLPICFADGDAPYLIGREGFFDRFNITLDKKKQWTIFTSTH
jgi:hypothetical protein